jgi:hypothetical protein
MGMDTQHSFDNAACIWTLDMHGCWNAGMPIKSSVRHRKFSVSLRRLVRHRHSGIMVSPVPLVTDQSVSAQLWYDDCETDHNIPILYWSAAPIDGHICVNSNHRVLFIVCRFADQGNQTSVYSFCFPFTVCSICKRKLIICLFVDKETNGSFLFANRLNGINGLNGLAHLWQHQIHVYNRICHIYF